MLALGILAPEQLLGLGEHQRVRAAVGARSLAVRGEPAGISARLAQCRDEAGNNVIRTTCERPGRCTPTGFLR
jgi:hypothetical protein